MERRQTYIYYSVLLVAAAAAFWHVIAMQHPMKYDIIDQAYPWRYFIGECLQEGMLPLWNPYQLLGSPIHADPQSSAWYPVTWFFGYLFGYNIYLISIDFFLHIWLAGLGMFYLARQLKLRPETALLMGMAYMLSGFFVGNAQHFMWIISGTWIPFIIGAFIALKEKPSVTGAIKLGLAFFMIMTGGYPAFVFLLLYLLLAVFILYLVDESRKKNLRAFLNYSAYLATAAAFTLLAGMVVLTSVYHLPEAMTRGSGTTLRQALFGAFTPQSFISFILPFASIREMDFYGTDLSMTNAYFGLVVLIFFIAGLMIRRSKIVNLFLVWGIFCLAAAVGNALPVREFLYHYVPFMNLFRFPALFRVFVILSFVIVGGFAFNEWRNGKTGLNKKLMVSTGILLAAILSFVVYSLTRGNLEMGYFIKNQLFIFSEKSTVAQHILFQGIIQAVLLVFLIIIFWKKKELAFISVLLIAGLDLVFSSRLNGPYTVYDHRFNSVEIYNHAKAFPDGFPLPDNRPVADIRDTKGKAFQVLWRNMNIFYKEISWEGYNPLHLKGFEEIADQHPELFETILQNPVVYFTNEGSPTNQEDTVIIKKFSPQSIELHSISENEGIVNYLQNNYYGWKATVDGNPVEIQTANFSFLSVRVPAGEHEVIFKYDPKGVKVGFWISFAALAAGIGFIIFRRFYR